MNETTHNTTRLSSLGYLAASFQVAPQLLRDVLQSLGCVPDYELNGVVYYAEPAVRKLTTWLAEQRGTAQAVKPASEGTT